MSNFLNVLYIYHKRKEVYFGEVMKIKSLNIPLPHSSTRGYIDNEPLLARDHDPTGEHRAVVVAPQTNPIDTVPGLSRVSLVELLPGTGEDGVDPRIGIVHKNVQFARLLSADLLEEFLHICINTVVHLDWDWVASTGLK